MAGMGRKERGAELKLAWLFPVLLMPLCIGVAEVHRGWRAVPDVLVAAAIGAIISWSARSGPAMFLASLGASCVLLTKAFVDSDVAQPIFRPEVEQSSLQPAVSKQALRAHPDTRQGTPLPVALETRLETISVVLPCAGEGQFAVKTVDSLLANTAPEKLAEIIVVDDGSEEPLSKLFASSYLQPDAGKAPLRILRHEKTLGLINAKQTGGEAAQADVIVFLDCHINPRKGWDEEILKVMKQDGDHRTVAVPKITGLNPNTWEINDDGSSACFLSFDAEFPWLELKNGEVPVMSGGLLAISKRWFEETEGYDKDMLYWGGENLDQSLRIWLCGGRIRAAKHAVIGHMWRDDKNPNTTRKVKTPMESVNHNKARFVRAWMDDFAEKALQFPEFAQYRSGELDVGDLSMFSRLKKKLQCRPFADYIRRFPQIYLKAGYIPDEVFQLRETTTGLCLERMPKDSKDPQQVVLQPCAQAGVLGAREQAQLWHRSNRDMTQTGGPCCGGLANWNFMMCLDAGAVGGALQSHDCSLLGDNRNQLFGFQAGDLLWRNGSGCLAPLLAPKLRLGLGILSAPSEWELRVQRQWHTLAPPTATVERVGIFLSDGQSPESFRLKVGLACAEPGQGTAGAWLLRFHPCDENEPEQVFQARLKPGGLEIRAGDSGLCLDAAGGSKLILYPCYNPESANANQVWHIGKLQQLEWSAGSRRLAVVMKPKTDDALPNLRLDSPTMHTYVSGNYTLASDSINQFPVWEMGSHVIFSGADGAWYVGKRDEALEGKSRGWLQSPPHDGNLPDRVEGQWSYGNESLFVPDAGITVTVAEAIAEDSVMSLSPCAEKPGQQFTCLGLTPENSFHLQDAETGECLGISKARSDKIKVPGGSALGLSKSHCQGDGERWVTRTGRGQLQHKRTRMCMDAYNGQEPIVYPCHEPTTSAKQKFSWIELQGWILMDAQGEGKSKRRMFELCLDSRPRPVKEVLVQSCSKTRMLGTRWEKLAVRTPLERNIWNALPPAAPNARPLGQPP